MAHKKSKAIKKLKKQVKKLNKRINDISGKLIDLQDAVGTSIKEKISQPQEETKDSAWPIPRFSEGEVEIAGEMNEDAEEIDDILEKTHR